MVLTRTVLMDAWQLNGAASGSPSLEVTVKLRTADHEAPVRHALLIWALDRDAGTASAIALQITAPPPARPGGGAPERSAAAAPRFSVWARTAAIVAAAAAVSGGLCLALYPLIGIATLPPGPVGRVLLWAPFVLPLLIGPACIVPLERTRAKLAAEAAERRSAQARLEEMARTDPLTGLLNRRGFFALSRSALGGDPILLTADVDDFKQVNDGWGHYCGDLVLRAVADRLVRAAGQSGCAARLGGDEFALLVPSDRAAASLRRAPTPRVSGARRDSSE
ncbi:MAG TPA: GGDEF domain-containing protein, partial [Acidimicrobiales bacterium]|nr:GGDEF domain-containing protein [Acidimicrobiales bacterium]